jgi:hypothetical protein
LPIVPLTDKGILGKVAEHRGMFSREETQEIKIILKNLGAEELKERFAQLRKAAVLPQLLTRS